MIDEARDKIVQNLQDILRNLDKRSSRLPKEMKKSAEIQKQKKRVYSRFEPDFQDIDNLSEERVHDFLSFKGNEHWTGLYRQQNRITKDMEKLRNVLQVSLDENIPLAERIDLCLKNKPAGLDKGILSAFLLVASQGKYAVWNKVSEKALKSLGIWPLRSAKFNGKHYEELNSFLIKLAKEVSTDLWTLDWLFWIIEEIAKSRIKFVRFYGADCKNQSWSWSFVNHEENLVIFGAWDKHISDNGRETLLFSEDWERGSDGRKKNGYEESREHIRLVQEENYTLKIFPMRMKDESKPTVKMEGFTPVLVEVTTTLEKRGKDWHVTHKLPTLFSRGAKKRAITASPREKKEGMKRRPSGLKSIKDQIRKGSETTVVHQYHNELQNKLWEDLCSMYGEEKVDMEENYIDLMVEEKEEVTLYEVKTEKPISCIRQGLGQLLSYVFYHNEQKRKVKIVIVGPKPPNATEQKFIDFVKKNLSIDFEYMPFS